jgi:CheY-like chemotaxis protein
MQPILILIPDLFFGVKVADIARAIGFEPREVGSAALLADAARNGAAAIVIDAQTPGDWQSVVRALKADPQTAAIPVLAFGPHVDVATSRSAVAAGVDRLVTRGKLARELPELLRQLTQPSSDRIS